MAKTLTFPQKILKAKNQVGSLEVLSHILFSRGVKISGTSLWRWGTGKAKAHDHHVAVIGKELNKILKGK